MQTTNRWMKGRGESSEGRVIFIFPKACARVPVCDFHMDQCKAGVGLVWLFCFFY